jgi:CheY-like chemotaxis protein
VILLDLFMPVMDGWAFREAQRRDPALASIPVIVVSADRGRAETARRIGAAGAVEKPISFDRLLRQVTECCC